MKKLFNQHGVIHLLPLFIIIVAVGIISFLLISATAPLNSGLFSKLNPKPKSHAQQMMMTLQDNCKFFTAPGTPVAFCDTFDTIHPGGRNGDLDDSRWQYSRIFGAADNPAQGAIDPFDPQDVVRCQSIVRDVFPDNDSFICGLDQPNPESNHWMESFSNGAGSDGALIKQPFDFTGRTGVITFDTDAKTDGSHTWWPLVCMTDRAYVSTGGAPAYPQNGFCIHFGETTSQTSFITDLSQQPIGLGGLDSPSGGINVFSNYVMTAQAVIHDNTNGIAEYVTQPDHANHFEIRVNQNSIEVWGSDKTDNGIDFPNFRRRFYATGVNLPLTRGFVTFGQTHYSPGKEGVIQNMTYHWHGLGFDGPTLPTVRGYDIPDAETAADSVNNGHINLGYMGTPGGLLKGIGVAPWRVPTTLPSLQNVNLNGVTTAYISANLWYVDRTGFNNGGSLMYQINGKGWNTYSPPPNQANLLGTGSDPASADLVALPVALSQLNTGSNTLEFKTNGPTVDIANITLDLEPGDILPLASNHIITGMPSGSGMPSMTPMPTSVPTNVPTNKPTSSPTSVPSATSVPSTSGKVGDINGDGKVDIFDYNILVSNFGKSRAGIQGDLNGDNTVNIFDYNLLVGNFGK